MKPGEAEQPWLRVEVLPGSRSLVLVLTPEMAPRCLNRGVQPFGFPGRRRIIWGPTKHTRTLKIADELGKSACIIFLMF